MAAEDRRGLGEDLRRGREEASGVFSEVTEIAKDFQTLMRQEVQLAKTEMQEQVQLGVRALIWGMGAALFGFLMLIFLFTGVMLALDLTFALWVSAFITTGITGAIAAIAGMVAMMRLRQVGPPQRTIESVKEDVEWAGAQVKSSRR